GRESSAPTRDRCSASSSPGLSDSSSAAWSARSVTGASRGADAARRLLPDPLPEPRQRRVVAVADVHVPVVELLVDERLHAERAQALDENARAGVQRVLVAQAAVDEHAA